MIIFISIILGVTKSTSILALEMSIIEVSDTNILPGSRMSLKFSLLNNDIQQHQFNSCFTSRTDTENLVYISEPYFEILTPNYTYSNNNHIKDFPNEKYGIKVPEIDRSGGKFRLIEEPAYTVAGEYEYKNLSIQPDESIEFTLTFQLEPQYETKEEFVHSHSFTNSFKFGCDIIDETKEEGYYTVFSEPFTITLINPNYDENAGLTLVPTNIISPNSSEIGSQTPSATKYRYKSPDFIHYLFLVFIIVSILSILTIIIFKKKIMQQPNKSK